MYNAFLGSVQYFAFNFAPRNWTQCNGQLLSIQQNQALFSLLGTFYGGNGISNFQLPDLRGKTIVGTGQGSQNLYTIGQTGGVPSVTMSLSQLPTHTHVLPAVQMPASNAGGTVDSPANHYPSQNGDTQANQFADSSNGSFLGAPQFNMSVAGQNAPFNNLSPYLVLNACICLSGIFPSRN